MNILYIGELGEYGTKICNYLSSFHRVYSMSICSGEYELDCESFPFNNSIEEIITEKNIDTVIFFESAAYDLNTINSRFFVALNSCSSIVSTILIIKERDIFRKRAGEKSISELLCNEYVENIGVQAEIVYTSCLYGTKTLPRYIQERANEIIKKNKITPNGSKSEYCDCLYIEDFCAALQVILSECKDMLNLEPIELQSGYSFPLNKLIDCIKEQYKQINVLPYSESQNENPHEFFVAESWTPKHNFLDDLSQVFSIAENDYTELQKSKRKKFTSALLKCVVLLGIFALIELYTQFISVSSDLQFVDLRLLFIVACSLILETKYGVVIAGLCSTASVLQRLLSGYRWYVLFFHIDNWIPIAVYFIVAIAIGSYSKKFRKE